MANLTDVSSEDIYAVCATLECAHEYDQIEAAKRMLNRWGVTRDQAVEELITRGAITETD